MEFSKQEYWSGLPFPSPGDLPDPGIEHTSPTLQADALPSKPLGKHNARSRGGALKDFYSDLLLVRKLAQRGYHFRQGHPVGERWCCRVVLRSPMCFPLLWTEDKEGRLRSRGSAEGAEPELFLDLAVVFWEGFLKEVGVLRWVLKDRQARGGKNIPGKESGLSRGTGVRRHGWGSEGVLSETVLSTGRQEEKRYETHLCGATGKKFELDL